MVVIAIFSKSPKKKKTAIETKLYIIKINKWWPPPQCRFITNPPIFSGFITHYILQQRYLDDLVLFYGNFYDRQTGYGRTVHCVQRVYNLYEL